jgi:hypothetical protein
MFFEAEEAFAIRAEATFACKPKVCMASAMFNAFMYGIFSHCGHALGFN